MRSRAEPRCRLLAVAGDLVEDIVVWAAEPLRAATDTAARVFRARGGSAANVAALAAPLVPTRFIGRVGADAAGAALADDLAAAGVDVHVQRAGRTGTVVLLVDAEGERTMFPDRGASAELADVDPAGSTASPWLHLPPTASSASRCAPSWRGSRRSPGSRRGRVDRCLVDRAARRTGRGSRTRPHPRDRARRAARERRRGVAAGDRGRRRGRGIRGAHVVVIKHGPLPTDVVEAGELVARIDVAPVARHPRPHGRGRRVRGRVHRRDAARVGCRDRVPRGARERAASVLVNPGAHASTGGAAMGHPST